jgi:hypothetical protein
MVNNRKYIVFIWQKDGIKFLFETSQNELLQVDSETAFEN